MSDLKDISHFLDDESATLSDLDWLDVDKEEHEKYKRLPKQNLDAIPDLEEQWKSLSDKDRYRLSPENRRPKHPNTPFWAEKDIANDITDEEKASVVESFFRRHLQQGVDAKKAMVLLKKNFDSHTLKAAKEAVRDTLKSERGLIGNVYVDSSLYPDCDQGQGQDEVRKNNKSAKFVLAKDECKGCVYNKQGTCARFQKEIVFDVNYDAQLWDYYRSEAEALGLDISEIDGKLPEKEKIRKAHLATPKAQPDRLDRKPIQKDATEDVTSGEAQDQLKSTEIKREIVGNVYRDRKVREVGRKMMAGPHGPDMMDVIASDPDLAELEQHRYLLGQLYVDLSFFDSREAAETYLNGLDHDPFVYGTPKDKKASSDDSGFSLNHPRVIDQLVHRYAVQKHGHEYQDDDGLVSTLRKVSQRLSGFESEKIRSFAQNVYSKPMPDKPKTYESMAPVEYDPTRGVDSESALKVLRASEVDREVVDHPYYEKQKRQLARKMMEGDHSAMMETRLADDDFDHLNKHLHLLGRLYVSSQLVGEAFSEIVAQNPHLQDLPDVDPDELDAFFNSRETQKQILSRYAQVKQIDSGNASRDVVASLIANVRDMEPDEVRKLAQLAFSKPLPGKTHEYYAYDQKFDPTEGISSDEALSEVRSTEIKRDAVAATEGDRQTFRQVAKRMMKGDHGPAVQAVIEADAAAHPLKKHLHLLGRLYTASFMFDSEDEQEEFYRRNSSLQGLPCLGDVDEVKTFFASDEAHSAILNRAALAQGLDPVEHGQEFARFVEEWRQKVKDKSSSQVRKLAQEIFQKPLPATTSKYTGTLFSTKQAKEARANVSEEQVQTFKDVVSQREPETVGYHLASSLKQDPRGRNILSLLNHHFSKEDVKALWFNDTKQSNRVRSVVDKDALEDKAYSLVTSNDFEPVDSDRLAITADAFDTKIGLWLRDQMMEGSTGKKLSTDLRNSFSKEQIVRNVPVILAMREEEGLFGTVFSMADAYKNCNRGKRELKNSSVTQIVRGSKCDGCIYNGDDKCMLYSKRLVDQPEYTQKELEQVLASRRKSGALQDVDIQAIRLDESDIKSKIRLAHRGGEMFGTDLRREAKPENVATEHHGTSEVEISKVERKIGEMLKDARQLLVDGEPEDSVRQEVTDKYGRQVVSMGSVYLDRVIERTRDHVSEVVSEENINATTGIEQMEEFEMLSGQANDPMSNFDYDEKTGNGSMGDVDFSDFYKS